jgi:hypothetical protein
MDRNSKETMKMLKRADVTMFAGLPVLLCLAAAPLVAQGGRGYGPGPGAAVPVQQLTEDEAKTLQFMREEEKLAHGVYQALSEKYEVAVFANIARSEERHFDAVGRLLTRYGVEDPAKDTAAGEFRNAELAALYSELMAKGALSLKDALEAGIAIEKHDIADLEKAIPLMRRTDIKRVFANLLEASLSHLEAFEGAHEVCTAQ